ncbi:MAG: class I SAM-dependent methyltransferase [Ferruginibacter sp.]
MFKNLRRKLSKKEMASEQAYDAWSKDYDSQPDNLMLALDEIIFSQLLKEINIQNKIIADIGCGTGRHWKLLMEMHPRQLTGYDVSAGMLRILTEKFPGAVTHKLIDNRLAATADNAVDILISTLTVAHIEDISDALHEWDRVAKAGADIIITDYHPDILQKGGKRTFKVNDKTVAVKNHVHPVEKIKSLAAGLGWTLKNQEERRVDDRVKHFYEKQNALNVFELYKEMPVIYGLHFTKPI